MGHFWTCLEGTYMIVGDNYKLLKRFQRIQIYLKNKLTKHDKLIKLANQSVETFIGDRNSKDNNNSYFWKQKLSWSSEAFFKAKHCRGKRKLRNVRDIFPKFKIKITYIKCRADSFYKKVAVIKEESFFIKCCVHKMSWWIVLNKKMVGMKKFVR